MTTATRYDFFRRTERKAFTKNRPALGITMQLPAGTTLAQALEAYYEAGNPKGSHRSGVFEVQTDEGIYEQVDGNRIDLSTKRSAAKTIVRTWEQL